MFPARHLLYLAAALFSLAGAALCPAQIIQNGSFENDYTGWTASGHQGIALNDANHPATDGVKVVVLNPNDQNGNAVLSQTFATTPGQRYELAFDYGVVGPISDQRLQVTLEGNGILFDDTILIAAPVPQPFYVPQHITFIANSASTKLTFADASYTYVVIDSMLDNVRVTAVNPGAPLISTQPQRLAVAQGSNAVFSVSASGASSYQWQFDGVDIAGATGSSYTVTAADFPNAGNYSVNITNANGTVTSSAATLTVLPPGILLNGSFEYGSAAWNYSGSNVSTSTNTAYGVTDGQVLTHFNWGQQVPDGNVYQVFATTPGETYVINFDLGAFSLVNQNQQSCRVSVTDSNNNVLVTQDFSVFAPGNGGRYTPETISFVASGATAKLTFQDISPTTTNVDLLLDNVRARLQSAPLITNQPQNATVTAGSSVSFTVTAAGRAPLHYQWRRNDGVNWVNVGADSGSFTIPAVQNSDAGMYDVVVSNGSGSAISNSVTLGVITPGVFANGSFESDYAGWTVTGNQNIVSSAPYSASAGSKAVAFNAGQQPANGTLSQSFTTTVGQAYTLSFDLGAFSLVNQNQMQMQVTLQGQGKASPLLNRSVSVFAPGNGTRYIPQSMTFVADSSTTTLTFQDTSPSTLNADLMLDNVQITQQPPPGAFTNGSFESDYAGWIATGNQGIVSGAPFSASDGAKAVAFNAGQQPANGVLTQTFATSPGQTYLVKFDVGAFSMVNHDVMSVQLVVQGQSQLVSQVFSVGAPGNGTTYVSSSASFIADSASTTLTFQDVSATTFNVDLLLDNVQVTAQNGPVISSQPQNQTAQAGGSVTFSVTAAGQGTVSYQWRFNNGSSWVDIAGANSSSLTINPVQTSDAGSYDVVVSDTSGRPAVISSAATLTVVPAGVPANGSFEFDYAGWSASGNQSIASGAPYSASDGTKAVVFNAGQQTPNGVLSQTIATTPNQTYVLTFDAGAFSVVDQDEQRLQVTVTGASNTALLSQTVSVFAPGNGTRYVPQTFTFTADGSSATLVFKDVSPTTFNTDLVLDNVRVTVPTSNPVFANGSFESRFSSWIAGGNIDIASGAPYAATDGVNAALFNAGQRSPNGVLTQTFATTAGQTYTLSFDVGAFSTVNQNEQRLQVSVTGPNNSTLLTPTTVSVFAPGNGTHYVGQTFTFVADGSTATIRFGDVSTTTTDVDLLLDNVQITNAAAPPAQPFTNGSFESGYTGWTETGNQSIENTSPYTAADGVNTVVFNAGQRQPNGVLSQTFSTSAGKTYSVSFALGAFSVTNQNPQAVSVSVTGINNGVLFAPQTFSVNAPGNGTTYVPQTFTFVANGSSATLTFTDVSSTTLNVDLLLDNVQVTVVSTP